ncbi:hypothetical protein ACFW2V_26155 [Streptomyces sp. NPDC058947]|uniref:hypothetical protein n=1 Tax=Streptomyces sp. NPDC058947 TaxID=3346675 RepID=UPI0036BFDFEC
MPGNVTYGPAGMPREDAHPPWAEIRRAARRLLPGCAVRRTLLWRYVLVWDRPREGGPEHAARDRLRVPSRGD